MERNSNNINENNANASLSRANSGVKYLKVNQNHAAKKILKQAKQNPIRTAAQGAARVGTGLATYAANIGRMGPVVEELEKWAISQGANITGRALSKQKFDSDSHRIAQIQIMQNTLNIMRLKELIMNQSLLIYNLSNVLLGRTSLEELKALNITKFPCYSDGTEINPEKFKSFMQKHNVPEDELMKIIKKNPITAMLYVEKLDFIKRQIGMVNWFQNENNNEGSEGNYGNPIGNVGSNMRIPEGMGVIGGKKKSSRKQPKSSVKKSTKSSVKKSTKSSVKKSTKSSTKKKPTKSSTKKTPTKSSTKKKPTKSSTKKQVKK